MSFTIKSGKNLKVKHSEWRHDTQHNDTQHNDTQHNDVQNDYTVNCFSERRLCRVSFMPSFASKPIMLSVVMLTVVMLNVVVPSEWVCFRNDYKRFVKKLESYKSCDNYCIRNKAPNTVFTKRRHDIQHKDTNHDDTQHDDIEHNDIQHDDIQHNDTQHDDIQHNDTQHDDIQQNDAWWHSA